MQPSREGEVTRILASLEAGNSERSDQLLPLVYDELRSLARARMAREPAGHTLQPTALVHEAFLRLVGEGSTTWKSRAHFFGAAAEAMRRILIERARRKGRLKHGGAMRRVAIEDPDMLGNEEESGLDLEALDAAIDELEQYDARKAAVVKLRFFAGLSLEDAAGALDVSPSTIKNDWMYARAWLHRRLAADTDR